jgi:para-nitrobenzyl esterase
MNCWPDRVIRLPSCQSRSEFEIMHSESDRVECRRAASRSTRIALWAALAVPAAGLAGSAFAAAADAPEARVAEGLVRGQLRDGVAVFRSIPYAAPPVGALRFRPPQPAKPWGGVREAIDDGPSCAQPVVGDPAGKASTTEDCLYLNVFAPSGGAKSNRPVMVWIHGGGWAEGFSGARQYDPSALVKEGGLVVVSINYRLGTLGLLATRSLDEATGELSGNQLIRDQQQALRWVHDNASAFGGDPGNVTIAGESAGANSVLALVASPLSRGLFQKAIVQSGVDDAHTLVRARAEQDGEELAEALGCAAGAGQAGCLRSLPVEAILKVRKKLGIVADPKLFPVDPYVSFRDGAFNRVPIIIGSNLHEGYLFASGAERNLGHPMTEPEYDSQMRATFGPLAEAASKAYPVKSSPSPAAALGDAITDVRFACYMDLARADASKNAPVYGFEMNEPDPVQQQPRPKVSLANTSYHTSDLAYLFDYDTAPLEGGAAALGRKWRGYWIQFARTGSPNGAGLPAWPRFRDPMGKVLMLSTRGGISADFAARHRCDELRQSGLVSREWM